MSDEPDDPKSTTDSEIEREVRQGRKVTARDVMARIAGPGAMKGASPISPVLQAETEIGNWLAGNLVDSCGALRSVVHRQLKGSQQLLENLDRPLVALADYCRQLVASGNLLKEIVREADVEWGRSMGERPFFEREGTPPDPEDPYTVASVRQALADALQKLPGPVG